MSKTEKIVIISIVIFILGAILAIVGYFTGGSKPIIVNKNGIKIFDENNCIKVNDNLSAFKNIEIISTLSDINIINSDKFSIEMVYPKDYANVEYSVQNDKLIIKQEDPEVGFQMYFGVANTKRSYINIYVPTNSVFEQINLKANSATLNINSIKANELTIDFQYGDVAIDTIEANSINCSMNSGDLDINNLLSNNIVNIENLYGDVDIFNSSLKMLDVKINSGKVKLKTTNAEKTTINNKYGDVEIDDIISNGMNITNESGDIELTGELRGNTIVTAKYGDVDIKSNLKEDEYSYSAVTKYGDIRVGKTSYESSVSKNNSDKNKIEAKAQSGDIELIFEK